MTAKALDNDFMRYWQKLNSLEKRTLLVVAKNYVINKDFSTTIAVYDDEINQLINPTGKIEQSDFYTQEQITEMTRNGL
jgi:hypothetical protein